MQRGPILKKANVLAEDHAYCMPVKLYIMSLHVIVHMLPLSQSQSKQVAV